MTDNQATTQVKCTCSCRDETPAFTPGDESWEKALRIHEEGAIALISERYSLPAWIDRLFRGDPPSSDECGHRINLAELHRLHMQVLQIELIKIGISLKFDGSAADKERFQNSQRNLEPALAKYTQAVRDYEYMTTSSRAYDYFIASSERHHDRSVVHDVMADYSFDKENFYEEKKEHALATGPWEKPYTRVDNRGNERSYANPIGGTRNEIAKNLVRQTFRWKLGAAIVGAGFLVGPMWLLALKQRIYLQLEVTTGFVFGFGLVLAYLVEKTDQVFAGTLAYAAVLMVFVGLSLQGSEGA